MVIVPDQPASQGMMVGRPPQGLSITTPNTFLDARTSSGVSFFPPPPAPSGGGIDSASASEPITPATPLTSSFASSFDSFQSDSRFPLSPSQTLAQQNLLYGRNASRFQQAWRTLHTTPGVPHWMLTPVAEEMLKHVVVVNPMALKAGMTAEEIMDLRYLRTLDPHYELPPGHPYRGHVRVVPEVERDFGANGGIRREIREKNNAKKAGGTTKKGETTAASFGGKVVASPKSISKSPSMRTRRSTKKAAANKEMMMEPVPSLTTSQTTMESATTEKSDSDMSDVPLAERHRQLQPAAGANIVDVRESTGMTSESDEEEVPEDNADDSDYDPSPTERRGGRGGRRGRRSLS